MLLFLQILSKVEAILIKTSMHHTGTWTQEKSRENVTSKIINPYFRLKMCMVLKKENKNLSIF